MMSFHVVLSCCHFSFGVRKKLKYAFRRYDCALKVYFLLNDSWSFAGSIPSDRVFLSEGIHFRELVGLTISKYALRDWFWLLKVYFPQKVIRRHQKSMPSRDIFLSEGIKWNFLRIRTMHSDRRGGQNRNPHTSTQCAEPIVARTPQIVKNTCAASGAAYRWNSHHRTGAGRAFRYGGAAHRGNLGIGDCAIKGRR